MSFFCVCLSHLILIKMPDCNLRPSNWWRFRSIKISSFSSGWLNYYFGRALNRHGMYLSHLQLGNATLGSFYSVSDWNLSYMMSISYENCSLFDFSFLEWRFLHPVGTFKWNRCCNSNIITTNSMPNSFLENRLTMAYRMPCLFNGREMRVARATSVCYY